jgi:hypothetical protein
MLVQTVGTGDGPYTVDVYSADLTMGLGNHLTKTGTTSLGRTASHDFTLAPDASIAFNPTNHPPIANAGPDQTVTATSPAGAIVTLDGSQSNDPDGDLLTFTWAGPFGLATGAKISPNMRVGSSNIQLTVDDGQGDTASSNVTVTVNPPTASCAADVSSSVSLTRSGFLPVYGSNKTFLGFTQTLTLNNISGATITGPIEIAFDKLPAAISIGGAGTTSCNALQGSPYVTVPGSTSLGSGSSVSVKVLFSDPSKAGVTYSPRVLAGANP